MSLLLHVSNTAQLNTLANDVKSVKISTQLERGIRVSARTRNKIFNPSLRRLVLVFPSAKYIDKAAPDSLFRGFRNEIYLNSLTIASFLNEDPITYRLYKVPVISSCSRTLKFLCLRHLFIDTIHSTRIAQTLNLCSSLERVWILNCSGAYYQGKFWYYFPVRVALQNNSNVTMSDESLYFFWRKMSSAQFVHPESSFHIQTRFQLNKTKKDRSILILTQILRFFGITQPVQSLALTPEMIQLLKYAQIDLAPDMAKLTLSDTGRQVPTFADN